MWSRSWSGRHVAQDDFKLLSNGPQGLGWTSGLCGPLVASGLMGLGCLLASWALFATAGPQAPSGWLGWQCCEIKIKRSPVLGADKTLLLGVFVIPVLGIPLLSSGLRLD